MKKQIDIQPPKVSMNEDFGEKQILMDCTKQAMAAYYTVYLDGKKLFRKRSESFHNGFITHLYNNRTAGPADRAEIANIDEIDYSPYGIYIKHAFTRSDFKYIIFPNSPEWNMYVNSGFFGPNYDGTYYIDGLYPGHGYVETSVSNSIFLPHFKNVAPSEGPDITNAFVKGTEATSWAFTLGKPDILLGKSNSPISILDSSIHAVDEIISDGSENGQLSYGGTSVFPSNIQKERAYFTISRTFNNISGSIVSVNDINIIFRNTGSSRSIGAAYHPLFIRDVFADGLSVPHDSTLTVEYEIGIQLDLDTQDTQTDGTNGGFLSPFISAVRTMVDGGFDPAFNGLNQRNNASSLESSHNNYKGIIVGTNDGYVSMTDEFSIHPANSQFSVIQPEQFGGPLRYYPTCIQNIQRDYVNQEIYWDIHCPFMNVSSSDVVIKEVGMLTDRGLIARHALHMDDWITVQPGKVKEFTYRIKFTE